MIVKPSPTVNSNSWRINGRCSGTIFFIPGRQMRMLRCLRERYNGLLPPAARSSLLRRSSRHGLYWFRDGKIYALNAATGEEHGSIRRATGWTRRPYSDNVLYAGSNDGNVYALDAGRGRIGLIITICDSYLRLAVAGGIVICSVPMIPRLRVERAHRESTLVVQNSGQVRSSL